MVGENASPTSCIGSRRVVFCSRVMNATRQVRLNRIAALHVRKAGRGIYECFSCLVESAEVLFGSDCEDCVEAKSPANRWSRPISTGHPLSGLYICGLVFEGQCRQNGAGKTRNARVCLTKASSRRLLIRGTGNP